MLTERDFTDAAERYQDMVYRIALNYFRHPADAEDAAQDVMLRLWQTDRTFEGDDYLRYFLVRVTLNVCRDISRRVPGTAARCPWRAAGSRPFPHRGDRSCSGRCWRCRCRVQPGLSLCGRGGGRDTDHAGPVHH